MTTSFKLTILAATLAATTVAETPAAGAGRTRRGAARCHRRPGPAVCATPRRECAWMSRAGRPRETGTSSCGSATTILTTSGLSRAGGELRNALNGTCLDAAGYDGQQGASDRRVPVRVDGRPAVEAGPARPRNVRAAQRQARAVPGRERPGGRARRQRPAVGVRRRRRPALELRGVRAAAAATRPPAGTDDPAATTPHAPADPAADARDGGRRRAPRAMEDGAFRALVGNVRNESFSDSQLAVVEQAAGRNWFRVGQIKSLIDLVPFSATKLRVLELCAAAHRRRRERLRPLRRLHLHRRQGTGPPHPSPQRDLNPQRPPVDRGRRTRRLSGARTILDPRGAHLDKLLN